jgi:hypothetical protein
MTQMFMICYGSGFPVHGCGGIGWRAWIAERSNPKPLRPEPLNL